MSMRLHDALQSSDLLLTEMPGMISSGQIVSALLGEMPGGGMQAGPDAGETPTASMGAALRDMPTGSMNAHNASPMETESAAQTAEMPAGHMNSAPNSSTSGNAPRAGDLQEMPPMAANAAASSSGSVIQLGGKWQLSLKIEA
jgi:hypothetical protein